MIKAQKSEDEKSKIDAYRAYEELYAKYDDYLNNYSDPNVFNEASKLDQRMLEGLIEEVANETLFEQVGETRSMGELTALL